MTAECVSVFPALVAGHLIGDWIVQTDWQAANKVRPDDPSNRGESWRANQLHMLGYHATLAICALPFVRPRRLFPLIAVSWASHSFIDRRWPVRWLMEHTGSGPFSKTPWGPIVVDQAFHLSILSLGAALCARPHTVS